MVNIDQEIPLLLAEIERLGTPTANGKHSVKFGKLVRDERCGDIFEALVGTLRAAKKRKIITYDGEMLLQGVHDDVDIVIL
ncbi:hypothetical protein HDU85_005816 [Gaertneriomyces sp. JEL0708]|nr:hypothetical protein HDU85_005816 [Gaertneriomyces sp. JEL0708]